MKETQKITKRNAAAAAPAHPATRQPAGTSGLPTCLRRCLRDRVTQYSNKQKNRCDVIAACMFASQPHQPSRAIATNIVCMPSRSNHVPSSTSPMPSSPSSPPSLATSATCRMSRTLFHCIAPRIQPPHPTPLSRLGRPPADRSF